MPSNKYSWSQTDIATLKCAVYTLGRRWHKISKMYFSGMHEDVLRNKFYKMNMHQLPNLEPTLEDRGLI